MDKYVWAVVSLRAAALALAFAGQSVASERMYTLADLIEAGKATDEHMAMVAEKLKNRNITDADWDDVISRIDTDSARLQGDVSGD